MGGDRLILIGVRHHSPACAALVRNTIRSHRPAFVLVEGPADFNPHLEDLRAPHALPVAIFSYHTDEKTARASYSPFCAYSPEWQALQTAWSTGATPLFCDLPSWHPDFGERDNRYADPDGLHHRYGAANAALERALSAEGADAVWDDLIEQRSASDLEQVLKHYFDLLRPEGAHDPREAGREAFMAGYAAWALKEAKQRPVVLVCGGWHVGGIRAALAHADGERPFAPNPADGVRAGSYLTPFSYARLDSFTGYASGMPSPAYYAQVHDRGLDAAADWAMDAIAVRLRQTGLPVSTADRIAWRANAAALARLRAHRAVLRSDVLDAALTTLVKDALSGPAAWTRGGAIRRGADDIVVAMLQALSGDSEGRLAAGTRQPPLIADVERRLDELGLTPEPKRKYVELDWREPTDRPRARALHQLRLLVLPGVIRSAAPMAADARDLRETFEIFRHPHWTGAIIEASRWGAELPMAAAARLHASILESPGNPAVLATALSDGLFAGLFAMSHGLAQDLSLSLSVTSDLRVVGNAGRSLARLYRYGEAFGPNVAQELTPVCEAAFARALWLCEGAGEAEALSAIDAVIAARDLAQEPTLALDRAMARGAFARLLANSSTPPALSGAALGYLIALGEDDSASPTIGARVRGFGAPGKLGDFLSGLFALAREYMGDATEALDAVDQLISAWTDDEFLLAFPSIRAAFAWFPPRERERLARLILQRAGYNLGAADAMAVAWMRQRTPIADQQGAIKLEAEIAEKLARYGLI
ncbi:MAG: DUF5682 family protein [Terricaulis sp.]